jgi:hypothetical protein
MYSLYLQHHSQFPQEVRVFFALRTGIDFITVEERAYSALG